MLKGKDCMCWKMGHIFRDKFWIIKHSVNKGNIAIDYSGMKEGSKIMSSMAKENNPPISILLLEHIKTD